jgi:predicted nucleic acid-binding Zn ribbon protein
MQPTDNPYTSPSEAAPATAATRSAQENPKEISELIEKARKRLRRPAMFAIVGGVAMTSAILILLAGELFTSNKEQSIFHNADATFWLGFGSWIGIIGAASLFSIYGGVQMLRLRQYRVCVAAAIVMTIPVISPCLPLGLLVCAEMLLELLSKNTRRAFAESNHQS